MSTSTTSTGITSTRLREPMASPGYIPPEERQMTDGEQTLALVSGALVMMWALRRGRLIPMAAMGLAAPLLAAGLRKRWPSELISWGRRRQTVLGRTTY